MAISTAVGTERISRIVGYKLTPGFFQESTPNLPQRIAIIAEGNTADQASFSEDENYTITSAKAAGDLFGYGSPIHSIMKILRPPTGGGIGGIPTVVYPQAETGGAAAEEIEVTVTGAATGNATHYVIVNGRTGVDGKPYAFSVVDGDTPTLVAAKIAAAISNVLGAPCTCTSAVGVATAITKWAGVSAGELDVVIDSGDNAVGLSYVSAQSVAASGAIDIAPAITQLGLNEWNTIVINSHGVAVFDDIETLNGKPDPDAPTGRYDGIVFKPFVSIWGSTESVAATLITITDAAARKDQVTHALAPAPNSQGFTWEAAANMALLFGRIMQDSPHKDVNGKTYSDMPVPADSIIGDMADYENRDLLVKSGCSTVNLVAGKYSIEDFVTTYHPDGETPPQYRYARNLMIDFNIRYGYLLLEAIHVVDHAIAESAQPVKVNGVIKPKQWLQVVRKMAEDFGERNIIVDVAFMQESIKVATSETNPDRLETFFRYKRSPYVRIASTTAEAGFAFGVE